jgi:hypothetical protein
VALGGGGRLLEHLLFDFDGIAGFPLGSHELSVEGETRKAGREAIRLVGVPEDE